MRPSIPVLIQFCLFIILVPGVDSPAAAQPVDRELRVGLVLGGGGARGAAHIGVLKELERQRVPIHAIAGTSMGAVIGGLYASGMTADELQDLIGSLDLIAALSDDPPRSDLGFRRKQDDLQYPMNLETGLKEGNIVLPLGVIQGQELDLLLRELTIRVSEIHDFDSLPIPFRAVASDIESGEAVVLDHGDLARALRASMSVPGMLAPVRIDDRLLVDGGLVGNLPIDVIRDMDVDVVIAVNVEFPLYAGDELDSVLAVTEQMLTILITKETQRQIATLAPGDILIQPDLGMFGSGEFGAVTETIQPGIDATAAVADRLGAVSIDESAYADHVARRAIPMRSREPLAFVRINHDSSIRTSVLQSRLRSRIGDPVDTSRLARDADRLYGMDLFEQVSYELVRENGQTGVEFQARSKGLGATTMQYALSLEDDFEGSTSFNIGTRMTSARLNSRGGEWRTDLQLGSESQLVSEFYQPFGFGSRLFVAPHVSIEQRNINTHVGEATVTRYRLSEAAAGVDFGVKFGSWGEFRIGADTGSGKSEVKIGDPAIEDIHFDSGGSFARFRIDTLDRANFPTRGFNADLKWYQSLTGLGADSRFNTIDSELSGVWSFGKNTFQLGLNYSSTLNGLTSIQNYFPLGGFQRLSGLERGQISGPHTALAKLLFYREVSSSAVRIFDIPVYVGASLETGNAWQSRSEMSLDSSISGASIFVGLDTYVGPLYFAAGTAEGGQKNFYLFVGSPPR